MDRRDARLYHITHVDNLRSMASDGWLWSDASIATRNGPRAAIGMSSIKRRRLSLPVRCHAGTRVGDYVPFYFCPRSIMLYVIHRANHAELTYRQGQEPIVHLEASLVEVVDWAEGHGHPWALTTGNAGSHYAEFYRRAEDLHRLDWEAIASNDWREPRIKEAKQAELLVHDRLPWSLIRRIGVASAGTRGQAQATLEGASHRPRVEVVRAWYY